MRIDFHTHGKLAKKLPFSKEYTDWLFHEAKTAGLDAVCLTEHFNTQHFDELYSYVAEKGDRQKDAYIFDGLKIFPGMETDIAEGGHVLCIGPMEAIRELNSRLSPYKRKDRFLPFEELIEIFGEYPVKVGAAHPFREGGNIPYLQKELLQRFDFIDLNGKDIAENRSLTERKTYELCKKLNKPCVSGSDTHQAVQYGCIKTCFEKEADSFDELFNEIKSGRYSVVIDEKASFKVRTATLLKRALKEVHALGGDYVSVILGKESESAAVLEAKRKCAV